MDKPFNASALVGAMLTLAALLATTPRCIQAAAVPAVLEERVDGHVAEADLYRDGSVHRFIDRRAVPGVSSTYDRQLLKRLFAEIAAVAAVRTRTVAGCTVQLSGDPAHQATCTVSYGLRRLEFSECAPRETGIMGDAARLLQQLFPKSFETSP